LTSFGIVPHISWRCNIINLSC